MLSKVVFLTKKFSPYITCNKVKNKNEKLIFEENPWSNLLILINNFIFCITTLFKIEKTYSSLFFLNALRGTIPFSF